MAEICSASHSPFVTTPAPKMFNLENWSQLDDVSNEAVELRFAGDDKEMTAWRAFRQSENSRYVTMTMPRVLSRPSLWGR